MHAIRVLIASSLLVMFGSAVACPGEKPGNQTQSGTVSKPLAPKPSV
jgi:hypothetical protein